MVANKFVEDAVVVKKFVVVALVEVEFRAVKFWRVEEPVIRTCPPSFAKSVFGSNQKGAVVVAEFPIAMISELFRE